MQAVRQIAQMAPRGRTDPRRPQVRGRSLEPAASLKSESAVVSDGASSHSSMSRSTLKHGRCIRCDASSWDKSPVDNPKAMGRKWGPGDKCFWCEELEALAYRVGGDDFTKLKLNEWPAYFAAYLSLVLEKVPEIDWDKVEARKGVLSLVAFASATSCSSSAASASGISMSPGGGPQCESEDVAGGASSSKYETPKGKRPNFSGTSSVAGSPSQFDGTPHTPASTRTPVTTAIKDEMESRRSRSRSPRRMTGAEVPKSQDSEAPLKVDQLSIEGKFPAGTTGQSLSRFRTTINSKADRMTQLGWAESFVVPTVGALERRLNKHEDAIKVDLNIDVIRAFQNLQDRVSSILLVHKHILAWQASNYNKDYLLIDILAPCQFLNDYFDLTSCQFAADLQILLMRAKFFRCFGETNDVSNAFLDVEPNKLDGWVKEVRKWSESGRPAVDAEENMEDDLGDTEILEPGGSTKRKRQAKAVARPKQVALRLPAPTSSKAYLADMLDRAIQIKLHRLPTEKDEFRASVDLCLRDFEHLLGQWDRRFPDDAGADECSAARLLESLCIVLRCGATDPGKAPKPSAVRAARSALITAKRSTAEKALPRCVAAMSQYAGPKLVMQLASERAAEGLQDQANDNQFDSIYAKMEKPLEVAFSESIRVWASTTNNGKAHDSSSYPSLAKLVMEFSIEAIMVCKGWSSARLESRLNDLLDCMQWSTMIIDCSAWVALDCFQKKVPLLAVCKKESGHDTEESLVDTTVAKEEDQEGDPAAGPQATQGLAEPAAAASGNPPFDIDALEKTATLVQSVCEETSTLLDLAVEAGNNLQRVHSQMVKRLGEQQVSDAFEKDCIDIKVPTAAVDNLKQVVKLVADYVRSAASLARFEAPFDMTHGLPHEGDNTYLEVLSSFCAAHWQVADFQQLFDGTFGEFTELVGELGFSETVASFHECIGSLLYGTHVEPSLKSGCAALESKMIRINAVDRRAMASQENPRAMLPMLMCISTIESIAKNLDYVGITAVSLENFEKLPHRAFFNKFRQLVESIGATGLPASALEPASGPSEGLVPKDQCMVWLEMANYTHSIGILASSFHKEFMMKLGDAQNLTFGFLTEAMAENMAVFEKVLVDFESFLVSPMAQGLEMDGWHTPASVSALRTWCSSMGVFRGRVLAEMLQLWCNHLQSMTESTRAACPAWDVCFQKGMFREQVASSILSGKGKQVLKAHNELHTMLSKLSGAGACVNLTPRLQEHHVCRETVTLALHILKSAKDCATVIEGVEVLTTYKQHHLGPSRAASFLSQHPVDKRSAEIPDIFWHELEVLKADCSPSAQQSTKASNSAAHAEVKTEFKHEEKAGEHLKAKVATDDGTKIKTIVKREVGQELLESRLRRRRQ